MLLKSASTLLVLAASVCAAEIRVVEEIIAKVNGDIITRGEIERGRKALEAELKAQSISAARSKEILAEKDKNGLREQIDSLLLVQRAKELNINVDPEVTRRIAQIQSESKITDPDKFQQWVREQAGQPFEDFKAQMRNQILTQRVVGQEVGSKISIPKAEVRKYYEDHKGEFIRKEQVFLREILISTEGKTGADLAAAEKKARDLQARARKGEKFPELARDNSDAASAKEFGDLGAWKKGQLDKQIEDIVFKEKKGFVTEVLKMPSGFLILRVDERHEEGQAAFEEVENEIMERLYAPRMEPKLREHLTKLRENAFLEIRQGYTDTGAAPGKDTTWKDPAQLKPETTTKEEVLARKKKRLFKVLPRPGLPGRGSKSGGEVSTPVPPPPAK
jgi:parvulin-like peptidyl-prolyl isomerase